MARHHTERGAASDADRDRDQNNVKADPDADNSNMVKDPDNWTTGDEPMTGAQKSYLETLSEIAHVPFDDNLTKAEASKRIDELREQTGRGQGNR